MKRDYRILVHDVVKKQKMLHKMMKMRSYIKLPPYYQTEAGELLRGWEEQASRWHQLFSEMLNREITKEEENELNVTHGHNCSISRETPTEAEIRKAVRQVTAVKAPGAENISPEALKSDKETSVKLLHPSLADIWDEEEIPDEWNEDLTVKLPLKA